MKSITAPLRLYESKKIGTISSKDGQEFSVVVGLDKNLVAQLKEKSLDESDLELQKNTSDRLRFGEGSYEEWYTKDRTPFALVDSSENIAALIWLGPEDAPLEIGSSAENNWDTVAFRSYIPYRGVGLMTEFSTFVFTMYARMRPHRSTWLQINTDNEAGKRLYQRIGFVERGTRASNGRIIMVRSEI